MHDQPDPCEILEVAVAFLRDELLPVAAPEQSFKLRVLANALELVKRQLEAGDHAASEAQARLESLLGKGADNTALAQRIEQGAIALDDPALIDHLWATTLAKIAVDQPRYASFRAEIEE